MCECQGNPLARVTLALGLPYLLVERALVFLFKCMVGPYQDLSFCRVTANSSKYNLRHANHRFKIKCARTNVIK